MRINNITVQSPSFTVVKIDVSILEKGFVEQLEEPAIKRCLYGSLWSLGIQYKEGKSISTSLVWTPNEDKTDRWISKISPFVKLVRWYVLLAFPLSELFNSFCKQL